MHQSSGRVGLGFSLALLTAVLWGLLPIALKWLLSSMSAATITWIRFVVAAVLVGLVLLARSKDPVAARFNEKKEAADPDCHRRFITELHFVSEWFVFANGRNGSGGDPAGALFDDVRCSLFI